MTPKATMPLTGPWWVRSLEERQQPVAVKRKRLQGAERRQLILEAARREFARTGYASTRMQEVAKQAGVTEAMVYRHFGSKDKLFEEAIVSALQAWSDAMSELAEMAQNDADSDLRAISRESGRVVHTTMAEIVPLLGVAIFGHPNGREFYVEKFAPILDSAYEAMKTYGEGWMNPTMDPMVPANASIGLHFLNAMEAHFRGTRVDAEHVAAQFTDLIFDGLAGRAGAQTQPAKSTSKRTTRSKRAAG